MKKLAIILPAAAVGSIVVFSIIFQFPYLYLDDKVKHMIAYSTLTIVLSDMLQRQLKKNLIVITIYAAIASCFFGTIIELLQIFVPKRVASIKDIAANIFGAIIGGITFIFFRKLLNFFFNKKTFDKT